MAPGMCLSQHAEWGGGAGKLCIRYRDTPIRAVGGGDRRRDREKEEERQKERERERHEGRKRRYWGELLRGVRDREHDMVL